MKRALLIFIMIFIFTCSDREFKHYHPANPPCAVEMKKIIAGEYSGDYLLVLRSENRGNNRFDGYLIFVYPDRPNLDDPTHEINEIINMDYEDFDRQQKEAFTEYIKQRAGYILGNLSVDRSLEGNIDLKDYNLGIDTQMYILFSDSENQPDSIAANCIDGEDPQNDNSYNIITRRYRDNIIVGSWLVIMVYLLQDYDDFGLSRFIAGISSPSVPVEILP